MDPLKNIYPRLGQAYESDKGWASGGREEKRQKPERSGIGHTESWESGELEEKRQRQETSWI